MNMSPPPGIAATMRTLAGIHDELDQRSSVSSPIGLEKLPLQSALARRTRETATSSEGGRPDAQEVRRHAQDVANLRRV